jgi:YjbE family integral membrane protein
MSFSSPEFWIALLQIIGVNIVLSGDNAVVIALAARSLPPAQQKKAVAWGSGAAVVMRIVLTIIAVELLRLPYLKLVGAALLLWIALQLLLPEDEGHGGAAAGGSLAAAIKTILLADLVMSLDNVIAVAAAAKGSLALLIIGLAISIPLVVFASTLLLNLMGRFPVIITLGAGLLGWVAGEMAISDPAVKDWIDANMAHLHFVAPALGAAGVVALGKYLAGRAEAEALAQARAETPAALARGDAGARRILLAVDGSEPSRKAIEQVLALSKDSRDPQAMEIHLANVQPSLPGDVSGFVSRDSVQSFHHEHADAALKTAREMLQQAGLAFKEHEAVGHAGPMIAEMAQKEGCDLIVMGTRGLGAKSAALLGSVAQSTLEHATVPVLLVK